ncbi:MAG: glycoside hydrolase family 27 protein [Clostridiales bacterium]|nr:glycoside hydrolase family 27 protein [Clostridiales bacterium]
MDKNDFCPTPPMGWNSYDYYDTTVTEEDVKRNADYLAENLLSYGWEYVVVDIQWYAHGAGSKREQYQYIPFSKMEMDEYSRFLPDPERFPSSADGSGFTKLAEYVHAKGLKFGIHIMRGIPRLAAHLHGAVLGTDVTADEIADPSSISKWNPDMYGVRNTEAGQKYYDSLLQLYASWGVDFIKCDDICNTNAYPHDPYSARHEVEMLARAIEKTGRKIVLSLSPGPALIEEVEHYRKYANMWRITDDFWDNWSSLKDMFERCRIWQDQVSAGCYPDCDMLPVGMLGKGFGNIRPTGFTFDEQRTMLTLWCLFGSPLMIGSELPAMNEETVSLLTNREILAMCAPKNKPHMIRLNEDESVWEACSSEDGVRYIALFNLSETPRKIGFDIGNGVQGQFTELWTGRQYSSGEEIADTIIPPHGCLVFR